MARITFLTGTMSSGKTTHLLQAHFNIEDAFPGQVILLNKNDRSGESICSNRMGGMSISHGVDDSTSIIEVVSHHEQQRDMKLKYIFVDEVQFFTVDQVDELAYLADVHDITVNAYGLLTSYKGELFMATRRILELADRIIQINNGMRCWCGQRATHNGLYLNGKKANSGMDTVVDNSEAVDYQVMCRRHFLEHIGFHSQRKRNS